MAKGKHETALPDDIEQLIKKRALLAAGLGIVPVPLVSFASATAIQLSLVQAISKRYGNEVKKSWVKNILTSVLGGVASTSGGTLLAGSLAGFPVVGLSLSVLSTPALSGLTTYAVGYMFVRYFESDKGLIRANAEAFATWFKEGFKSAREKVGDTISGKPATTSTAA
jgi:uncharacterized protein (DUF697 family)